jgi:hypothetical protein
MVLHWQCVVRKLNEILLTASKPSLYAVSQVTPSQLHDEKEEEIDQITKHVIYSSP